MAFFTHHSVWKSSKTSIFHWFVRWRVWKQFPDYSDNLFSILNKMCQTSVFYGAIFILYAQLASLASLQIDIITSFLMISKHYAFLLQLSSIPKKKTQHFVLHCWIVRLSSLISAAAAVLCILSISKSSHASLIFWKNQAIDPFKRVFAVHILRSIRKCQKLSQHLTQSWSDLRNCDRQKRLSCHRSPGESLVCSAILMFLSLGIITLRP